MQPAISATQRQHLLDRWAVTGASVAIASHGAVATVGPRATGMAHCQWRPQLRDPADEMVLEATVNAQTDALPQDTWSPETPARP